MQEFFNSRTKLSKRNNKRTIWECKENIIGNRQAKLTVSIHAWVDLHKTWQTATQI